MFFCSAFVMLAGVSATDVAIDIQFDFSPSNRYSPFKFPIELNTDNYIIETFGYLSFGRSYIAPHSSIGANFRDEWLRVNDLTIVGSGVTVPTNWLFVPPIDDVNMWSSNMIGVPGIFGSFLTDQIGSYMIVPTSSRGGQMVMNPIDPTAYAYEGGIMYTNRLNGIGLLLRASVLDNPPGGQEIQPVYATLVELQFYDTQHRLPRELMQNLQDWITESAVLIISDSQPRYRFQTESVIDELPSLRFAIESHDTNQPFFIALSARDYLVPVSGEPNVYQLNVAETDENRVMLGSSMLTKMVIHFDAINRRIGFGEPLVTLN